MSWSILLLGVISFSTSTIAADSLNGVIFQTFDWFMPSDGNHWNNVARDYSFLGKNHLVTAVWLPPAYKGAGGANDTGYGVYDRYDLGEFDQKGSVRTKYGTSAQYLNMIRMLHKSGVQVYGDIVLNHMTGADTTQTVSVVRVDSGNRNQIISGAFDIDAYVGFNFSGRAGKYSQYQYTLFDFNGVDYANNLKDNDRFGIFKFAQKNWNNEVDSENGNYDFLMGANLDMDHPETRRELIKWGEWYTQFTGIDGYRIDAVKHIQFSFFEDWLNDMRNLPTHSNAFAVGEYYSANADTLKHYIDATHRKMSLFDFSLRDRFLKASHAHGFYDMGSILNDTLVSDSHYQTSAVTFVDNHDLQPGRDDSVEIWFRPLAYAAILLREGGYPCVFAPDYFGAKYTANGKSYEIPSIKSKLDAMLIARRNNNYGPQNDYLDDQDVIGWTRLGDATHKKAMAVVLNDNGSSGGTKTMSVGARRNGSPVRVFKDVTGENAQLVQVANDGIGTFSVKPASISIWIEQ